MTRFLAAVLVLVLGFAAPSAQAAPKVERVISPGGIEAWLVSAREIPVISVEVAFRGGAALDPPGKGGTASLLSTLLDEGAGDLDSKTFQARLEDQHIRLGFGAGDDALSASMTTLTATRDDAFGLLGLALSSPRLDAEPIERMRQSRMVSLAAQEEDPDTVAARAWAKAAYGTHPYARPTGGTLASVPTITRDDLAAFAKARIARDALLVTVVGDIDAATLGPLLDKTFGALPAKAAPADVPMATLGPARVEVIHRDVPQSVVRFGVNGILRADPDWYPASILNYVLGGGGFESRLMQEVRVKRGLAYGVSTYLVPRQNAGVLVGEVGTANAAVAKSIEVIRAELARMAADGVTEAELADAKTYLTGSFPLNLDSNAAIAAILMQLRRDKLPIDQIERRNPLIEAVTREDIARVAHRLLDGDHLIVVVVGAPATPIPGAVEGG